MAEIKFVSKDNLLYVWQKIKLLLGNKVDKVDGKGLSTNDFTDELKTKLLNAGDSSFSGNYDDLTNKPDLTQYVKTSAMNSAISTATADMATKTYVAQQLANINKKEVVTSLEEMTDANTIYLMANAGSGNNSYDEYIVVNGTPEKVGTTDVNLSGYIKSSDLVAITNEEIDAIFAE